MPGRFLLAALLLAAGSPAGAAVVLTKDGGRLEGTIVSRSPSELVLRVGGQDVRLDASQVLSVEDAPPAAAPAPPAEPDARPPRRARPVSDILEGGPDSLSFAFGVAAPLSRVTLSGAGGGSTTNGSAGPLLGLQWLHETKPRTGLGVELDWYDRGWSGSGDAVPLAEASASGDTVLVLGVVKERLVAEGGVRPYLLLGAGAAWNSTRLDARPLPGFAWSDTGTDEPRRLVDDTAWTGAFAARLGLDVGQPGPWTFGLELGWTGLPSTSYRPTAAGRSVGGTGVSGPLNYFTLAARLGWSL